MMVWFFFMKGAPDPAGPKITFFLIQGVRNTVSSTSSGSHHDIELFIVDLPISIYMEKKNCLIKWPLGAVLCPFFDHISNSTLPGADTVFYFYSQETVDLSTNNNFILTEASYFVWQNITLYHSSIVGSKKPFSHLRGRNSNVASAFRAIWAQLKSTSTLDLVHALAALNKSTHHECEIRCEFS